MTLKHAVEAARVGGSNLLFGSSLASLSLAARPRAMIQYLADSLFLNRAMSGRRGLPQRNVVDVLAGSPTQSIRLGSLGTGAEWFWPQASYTQDIVSLCLICQILQPRRVFEIGTLWGYTSYHFALNTRPTRKSSRSICRATAPPRRACRFLSLTARTSARGRRTIDTASTAWTKRGRSAV